MNLTAYHVVFTLLYAPKDISLIVNVFKDKYVNEVVVFHCGNIPNVIKLPRTFMTYNLKANMQNDYDGFNIPKHFTKVGIVLNTLCNGWSKPLEKDMRAKIKSLFVWIIITKDISSTVSDLSQFAIEIDTDLVIAHEVSDNFVLYEAYNTGFKTNGVFTVKPIESGKNLAPIRNNTRRDLNGVVLKCPIIVTDNIVGETFEQYLKESKPKVTDSLHKFKTFSLLMYLKDMYNFSYILQRTNSWGYQRNGSFDGIVGALQHEKADMGGSPVFFKLDRAMVLDYVVQTWQSKPCFILRHPKHPGGIYTIYTRPLTGRVWFCIMLLLIVLATLLHAMLRLKILRVKGDDKDSTLSYAVIFVWSAICQQGVSLRRSSSSVKIVIFITFAFTVTLYQYYTATVVSTLLRQSPKSIRTLNDLLKSNLKVGVENVLYNIDFFKRTTDPVALELYHKKIATGTEYNFFDVRRGMALVRKGGFAFHVDNVVAYRIMKATFTEREICEAHEVSLYPPQKMAIVVRKGLPYKEHIVYGVRKMHEAGLMKRLKSVWDETKPECVNTPDSSIVTVTIREFSTALMALVIGMCAAVLVLLVEILVHSISKRGGRKHRIKFLH